MLKLGNNRLELALIWRRSLGIKITLLPKGGRVLKASTYALGTLTDPTFSQNLLQKILISATKCQNSRALTLLPHQNYASHAKKVCFYLYMRKM